MDVKRRWSSEDIKSRRDSGTCPNMKNYHTHADINLLSRDFQLTNVLQTYERQLAFLLSQVMKIMTSLIQVYLVSPIFAPFLIISLHTCLPEIMFYGGLVNHLQSMSSKHRPSPQTSSEINNNKHYTHT